MGFAVAGTAGGEIGTSLGTNNAQTLPSTAVGTLIVVWVTNDAPSTTNITASTGWTQLFHTASGSTEIKHACFARVLDGGANDTLTISGAAQDYCVSSLPITNHGVSNVATDIKVGTAATAATGNADPPSLSPGSTADWLWIASCGVDFTTGNTISAVPTNYTSVDSRTSASSTSSCGQRIATRALNGSTENPGTFTNTSRPWVANTIAVPGRVPSTSQIEYFETAWNTAGTLSGSLSFKDITVDCLNNDRLVVAVIGANDTSIVASRSVAVQSGSATVGATSAPTMTPAGADTDPFGAVVDVTADGAVVLRGSVRTQTEPMGIGVWRIPSALKRTNFGWLSGGFVADADGQVSVTLAATGDVFYASGSWTAATSSTTVPSGGTIRQNTLVAGQYTPFLIDWQGRAAGTTAYGPGSIAAGDLSGVVFTQWDTVSGSPYAVSGTIAVVSAQSGSPLATRLASGAAPNTTGMSGAPLATRLAAGTIPVVSGMSGSVTASRLAAGTIAAISGMSGAVGLGKPVSGTIAAISGMSGAPLALRTAAGTIVVISGMSGSPTVAGGPTQYPVSGTIVVVSGMAGSVGAKRPVSGSITVVSAMSGAPLGRYLVSGTTPVVSGLAGVVKRLLSRYFFSPPELPNDDEALPARPNRDRLYGMNTTYRTVDVLKVAGAYRQYDSATADEIAGADVAYLGGRRYEVSGAERAALIAAGYADDVESQITEE